MIHIATGLPSALKADKLNSSITNTLLTTMKPS